MGEGTTTKTAFTLAEVLITLVVVGFLNYTSNTMGGMSFVFDINGNRGPNSEMQGKHFNDIISFNGARFPYETRPAFVCDKYTFTRKLEVNGTCYFELPTAYQWGAGKTACQNTVSGATMVGKLPGGFEELHSVCEAIKAQNGGNNLSPFSSVYFWSAQNCRIGGSSNAVAGVAFYNNCNTPVNDCGTTAYSYYVLCEGK